MLGGGPIVLPPFVQSIEPGGNHSVARLADYIGQSNNKRSLGTQ